MRRTSVVAANSKDFASRGVREVQWRRLAIIWWCSRHRLTLKLAAWFSLSLSLSLSLFAFVGRPSWIFFSSRVFRWAIDGSFFVAFLSLSLSLSVRRSTAPPFTFESAEELLVVASIAFVSEFPMFVRVCGIRSGSQPWTLWPIKVAPQRTAEWSDIQMIQMIRREAMKIWWNRTKKVFQHHKNRHYLYDERTTLSVDVLRVVGTTL